MKVLVINTQLLISLNFRDKTIDLDDGDDVKSNSIDLEVDNVSRDLEFKPPIRRSYRCATNIDGADGLPSFDFSNVSQGSLSTIEKAPRALFCFSQSNCLRGICKQVVEAKYLFVDRSSKNGSFCHVSSEKNILFFNHDKVPNV